MGRKSRGRGAHAGATPAIRALDDADAPHEILTYTHDDRCELGFGPEAARALGEDPAAVLKTLLVGEDGEDRDVGVCVIPVDRRLSLKAAAHALGLKKVSLIEPSAAERITGYVVGGISPLGHRRRLPTMIDDSVKALDRVVVSGGRRGMSIALAPADLASVSGGAFAPLTA
ncbi:Cys-tRNA(Pro) deacylase [Actinomyces sp. oral taxon 448]|jgi:ybaK/ebsC protein|uniref:Cys-tRNA(Pro) deacylase n=1 Tax=Actinomyces sp. oral taxon 448 TaxID=712124 RepID=UPI0002189656|nr:Cys-tRNA(Pro) deacylase [Actinomyces sp. oral taxon 448]EGQ73460.1 YbaK/ebsC protein [Actinomyces sp. oral taxon 448 str. F0400]